MKPQIWDQSKRVWANKVFNWSKWLSMSSKVCLFRSLQTSHIKQAGTMFQISESCLPNQFLVALMFLIISWTHTHTHKPTHYTKPFFVWVILIMFCSKIVLALVVLFKIKKTYKHGIGHCQWILLFLMWMLFLYTETHSPYWAVQSSAWFTAHRTVRLLKRGSHSQPKTYIVYSIYILYSLASIVFMY